MYKIATLCQSTETKIGIRIWKYKLKWKYLTKILYINQVKRTETSLYTSWWFKFVSVTHENIRLNTYSETKAAVSGMSIFAWIKIRIQIPVLWYVCSHLFPSENNKKYQRSNLIPASIRLNGNAFALYQSGLFLPGYCTFLQRHTVPVCI